MTIRTNNAKITKAVIRDDGFLVVTARISREGVMDYQENSSVVKELLPREELESAYNSFKNTPITIDHQGSMVTKDNKDEIVNGLATDVWIENGWVYSDLVIMNDDAIEKALSTHGQISVGYYCKVVNEAGTFTDSNGVMGTKNQRYNYQTKQTNLRGNHVSLVENARAGSDCAIINSSDEPTISQVLNSSSINSEDSKTVITTMNKINFDNFTYTVEGNDSANVAAAFSSLQNKVNSLETQITNLQGNEKDTLNAVTASKDAVAVKDSEIAELKTQVAALTEKVNATEKHADTLFSQEDVANEATNRINAWDKAQSVLPDLERDYSLSVAAIKDLVWEQADKVAPASKANSSDSPETVETEINNSSSSTASSFEAARAAYLTRRQNKKN